MIIHVDVFYRHEVGGKTGKMTIFDTFSEYNLHLFGKHCKFAANSE